MSLLREKASAEAEAFEPRLWNGSWNRCLGHDTYLFVNAYLSTSEYGSVTVLNCNLPRLGHKLMEAVTCSTHERENSADGYMEPRPDAARHDRSPTEAPPIHRPSSGAGIRQHLVHLRKAIAACGQTAGAINRNAGGASQRDALTKRSLPANQRYGLSNAGAVSGMDEIQQIIVPKEMNKDTLVTALRSSLEALEKVIAASGRISHHLETIRQRSYDAAKLRESLAGGSKYIETDLPEKVGTGLNDCLVDIKREVDALQEMAFRTAQASKPAELRSMVTGLSNLRDLTYERIKFTEPLPPELVRISWDAAEILNKPLPVGGQSEDAAVRFRDLADPVRYYGSQRYRPITAQLLTEHGAMIAHEIQALANIHDRVEKVLKTLEEDLVSKPVQEEPVAGPSNTRKPSAAEPRSPSSKAAKPKVLEVQETFTEGKSFSEDVMAEVEKRFQSMS